MGSHEIRIEVVQKIDESLELVQAVPNPSPSQNNPGTTLQPGDTVVWKIPANREMRVVFEKRLDLPGNGAALQDSDPRGPFESLRVERGQVSGRVRADLPEGLGRIRFLYALLEDGKELRWANKPPGAPDPRLGGGVDVPKKPPGSGGGG
ncbi:MAG TPA: hypothetical protein VF789_29315 [Thermoanaerobaculia bacterium]